MLRDWIKILKPKRKYDKDKTIFFELLYLNSFWYGGLTARLEATRKKSKVINRFYDTVIAESPTLKPHLDWYKNEYIPQELSYILEISHLWENVLSGFKKDTHALPHSIVEEDWKGLNELLFFQAPYIERLEHMMKGSVRSLHIIGSKRHFKSWIQTPYEAASCSNRWHDYLKELNRILAYKAKKKE